VVGVGPADELDVVAGEVVLRDGDDGRDAIHAPASWAGST
jgi:hypothetical protein